MSRGKKSKTHEEFVSQVKLSLPDYKVLSKYLGTHKKVKFQCPEGHIFTRIAKDQLRYKTCPICTKKHQYTTEEFKGIIYDLVGDEYSVLGEYKTTKSKISFKHNTCGTVFDMTPDNFKNNGKRCPYCKGVNAGIRLGKTNMKSNEDYLKELSELTNNYKILEEYKGSRTNIVYKHLICGNIFQSNPQYFNSILKRGNEPCPYCRTVKDVSDKEIELQEFIKSFYKGNIIFNDRTVLDGLELDIYLPDDNFAIEFNGLYWHSEEGSNGKCNSVYHLNKTKKCEEKGIRLLHIFENDWSDERTKKLMKSKIKHILGYDNKLPKLRASKCYIKEISTELKDNFLDKNHIQGPDKSTTYNFGLFDKSNKKLVAVMTFTRMKNNYNEENDYNLSRYASTNKIMVYGAFSKLLKYFKENYVVNDIYTFADRTWSIGNLYDKNGFIVDAYVRPDYKYYKRENGLKLEHKFAFRKKYLRTKFPEIKDQDKKTEKQIMKEAGYLRVWNCGLIRYKLSK